MIRPAVTAVKLTMTLEVDKELWVLRQNVLVDGVPLYLIKAITLLDDSMVTTPALCLVR